MQNNILRILCKSALIFAAIAAASASDATATERPLFVSVGDETRPPLGWVEFCAETPDDCKGASEAPRDATLTPKAWKELVRLNAAVNQKIRPLTDLDHYGVVEKWTYPDDGYGDCEDYVLLKQKLLVEAGWPRESLLITVVRDLKNEGHAVLTVKTDRGEFILDNQRQHILLWSETGYRFVKRQSQADPNVWVSLGDSRPAIATAAAPR